MITAQINQKLLRGGQKLPRRSLEKIFRLVSQKIKHKKDWQVSLAFVSPAQIKKINRAYRGQNRATDVLSFGFQEAKNAPTDNFLGEILICYPVAKKHAQTDRVPVRQEIYRLIIHGLLHLLGYRHDTSSKAKTMFKLQEDLLKKIV